ncbi:nuclear apoptosis-inducing factor 1-like [Lineus longissimus]|uniref:nuclear apoptosis-inducing factor 1-like n=1 Tax=Lineus longissimus TaxID=88925 RepID=UPI00315CE597
MGPKRRKTLVPRDDEDDTIFNSCQPKFSPTEVLKCVSLVEKNWRVINDKFSDVITLKRKQDVWSDITRRVNIVGTVLRTNKSIRHKWDDMKSKVKQKAVYVKKMLSKTGNVPLEDAIPQLTELEERIAGLIGTEMIEGITGGINTEEPVSGDHDNHEDRDFDFETRISEQELRNEIDTIASLDIAVYDEDVRSPSPPPRNRVRPHKGPVS